MEGGQGVNVFALPGGRAELQAQLALLAAQLADLSQADDNEVPYLSAPVNNNPPVVPTEVPATESVPPTALATPAAAFADPSATSLNHQPVTEPQLAEPQEEEDSDDDDDMEEVI